MTGGRNDGLQPLRDLDNVRSFLSSMGPGRAVRPAVAAVLSGDLLRLPPPDRHDRTDRRDHSDHAHRHHRIHDARRRRARPWASRRARNDLAADQPSQRRGAGRDGHDRPADARWSEANEKYLASNQRASDVAGGLGAVSKVLRMMLQSAVLAVGAYLVINQEATAGIIIAGSILSARALAPVDLAIAQLEGLRRRAAELAAAQRAARNAAGAGRADAAAEPRRSALSVEAVSIVPPGDQKRRRPGCDLHARGRPRPRHHRAERVRQVVAGARAGRRLAAGARQGPARRRGARPVVARRARPPHRLSAAGCRTVRRHRRPEHLPLRSRSHVRQPSSRPPRQPASTT